MVKNRILAEVTFKGKPFSFSHEGSVKCLWFNPPWTEIRAKMSF